MHTIKIRYLFRRLGITIIFPLAARKPDHVDRLHPWLKNFYTPSLVQPGEFWHKYYNHLLSDSYLIIIRDNFLILFDAFYLLNFESRSAKIQVNINKIFGNNFMDQSPFEKLTGPQLINKFCEFYGTRVFSAAFTTAQHLPLSSVGSVESTPFQLTF